MKFKLIIFLLFFTIILSNELSYNCFKEKCSQELVECSFDSECNYNLIGCSLTQLFGKEEDLKLKVVKCIEEKIQSDQNETVGLNLLTCIKSCNL